MRRTNHERLFNSLMEQVSLPKLNPTTLIKSHHVFGQHGAGRKCFMRGYMPRVSTNDQQTLTMPNRAMREYAARRGWTLAL